MKYGMPTLLENDTLEKNIRLCKKLGLDFLELNMNFPEYRLDSLRDTEKYISLAEENGIYFSVHLDEGLNIADFNPLVREAYLETIRRVIETAKQFLVLKDEFGDKTHPLILNMHMHHGIHMTLPDRKVQMYERDFDVYMQYIKEFREKAEAWIADSDIMIAVENTNGFREYEKKALNYLLESPVFALTWDIGHSKVNRESDLSFLMEHKNSIRHFHIHDAQETTKKDHLTLGDGEINLKSRFELAEDCNAGCVIETKTIRSLEKSVEWIHRNRL